uniref:WAP domain-containing protein n=1 Tax=Chrysemys picta bellii TaxID=8478 RepID=A0A8C3IU20_CHRPI
MLILLPLLAEKAGYCPVLMPAGLNLSRSCRPCLANRSCSTCFRDADCPGPEKCCPGRCGTRCWEPVSGKRTYDRPYRVSPVVPLAPYPVLTEARPRFWQSGV